MVQSYCLHLVVLIYARSSGKLHFHFHTCRSHFSPIKDTLPTSNRRFSLAMPRTMFLFKQCICGGAARYRTGVQYVSTLLQRLPYNYNRKPGEVQLFFSPGSFFSKYGTKSSLFTMMDLLHNVTYLFATFACVVASSGSLTRPYCANGPLGPAIPSATKKRT